MMKIYCIPGGGTPASVFFRWKSLYKEKAEIKTLDYPRHLSKNVSDSVETVAESLFEKIKDDISLGEDYILLSSCTGCLIEYELYRIISEKGMKLPKVFVVFSAFPPMTDYYKEKRYISESNRKHICGIYKSLLAGVTENADEISQRCTQYLITESNEDTIFPPKEFFSSEFTYEQEAMLAFANKTIQMLDFDWYISSKYKFVEKNMCMIESEMLVFHASGDEMVSKEHAAYWKHTASGKFNLIELKGGHNIITASPELCAGKLLKYL